MIRVKCEIECNGCSVKEKVKMRPVIQENGYSAVAALEFEYPEGWRAVGMGHVCRGCSGRETWVRVK